MLNSKQKEKLQLVDGEVGTPEKYASIITEFRFDGYDKDILLQASNTVWKENPNMRIIESAYEILNSRIAKSNIPKVEVKKIESDLPDQVIEKISDFMKETPSPDQKKESYENNIDLNIKDNFCSNCGTKISDTAKFCNKCGEKVSKQKPTNNEDIEKNLAEKITENSTIGMSKIIENSNIGISKVQEIYSDKDFNRIKLFGVVANILLIAGVLFGKLFGPLFIIIIAVSSIVLTIIAMKKIDKLCSTKMYKDIIFSYLFLIFGGALSSSLIDVYNGTGGLSGVGYLALILGITLVAYFIYFFHKSFKQLSVISNIKLFETAGIIMPIGMLITILGMNLHSSSILIVGGLLEFISTVLFLISWFSAREFIIPADSKK